MYETSQRDVYEELSKVKSLIMAISELSFHADETGVEISDVHNLASIAYEKLQAIAEGLRMGVRLSG